MRTTPYGEPSDKEIDALLIPPQCPLCGEPVHNYNDICEICKQEQIETNDNDKYEYT